MTDLATMLAVKLVGTPYIWGGKNPIRDGGLDCSGLAELLLRALGADPPGVQNAQALYDHFSAPANHVGQDPVAGALLFYGKKKVDHVAFVLQRRVMVESGGGGPTVTSIEIAKKIGAGVRIVPIRFGEDFLGAFLPEYPEP